MWSRRLVIVSAAPIISFGSRFARNIILSRLLVPDEFGTALAIGVVLALGNLVTDVALDRFVMINDSARALSTAHALSIMRAVLVAAVLIAVAPALAALFGVANASHSFAIAACLSTIGGFAHLEIKQIQRNYAYVPQTIAQLAANLAAILALFPAISALHDHRAIIVSYAAESGVYVLFSHLLARTLYNARWERSIMHEALSFGLPLTLNGIGLAVIYQLDRTLVGYWFGVKELASYAVMLSVSVMPTNLILSIFSNMGMSYFLAGSNESSSRSSRYEVLIKLYAFTSILYVLGLALTLDIATPLIFGSSFTVSPTLHVLFAVIAFLRLQRSGAPTTLLLATGRTRLLALLNLSASSGLLGAWIGVIISARLESMLVGIAAGEFIAFVLSFALPDKLFRHGSKLFAQLSTTLVVPILVIVLLALFPAANWGNRGVVLCGGLLVIIVQFGLQIGTIKRLLFRR